MGGRIGMLASWGKKVLLAVAVLAALAGSSAQAGMIPVSVSVLPDDTKFRWTYGVIVTTDVKVNPGDSFTIYDFGGLLPGSVVAPPDWMINQSMTTTPHAGTNPSDDPGIINLSFTFTGTTPIEG